MQRLDGYQRRHRWLAVPVAVVYKFVDDKGGYLAALITYYGFLSLFPLLLIFTTLLGFALPDNPALQQQLLDSALSKFPIIGDQLASGTHPLRGSTTGLTLGIIVALYGGLGVAVAIQDMLDQVWEVPVLRRPDPFRARVRALRLLLLFALGIPPTAALTALAGGAVGGLLAPALRVAAFVLSIVVNVVLFLLAFRTLPTRHVTVREALPGAVLAGVGWQVLQAGGAIYLAYQLQGSSQVYGLFGIVLGLLAWIYLQVLVVVLAAELNAVLADRLWPRALLAPFVDDVDLTPGDRRSYTSYTSAERYTRAQQIDVRFDQRDGDERDQD